MAAKSSKVQSTYKISPSVKRNVDLLASVFGVEKSRIVEQALNEFAQKHRDRLRAQLREAQREIDALRSVDDVDLLVGRSRPSGYAGGPVERG